MIERDDFMDKVPTMISTKDLAYLTDIFNWNFTAVKKANHYLDEVENEEVKEAVENFKELHQRICNAVIKILG